ELNGLDVGEIHADAADVAGKERMGAVCSDVDVLRDVGAVEHQGVAAGPAVDAVAAVAGIPDERVVAVAELGGVVAAPADDEVTAVAADERVVALAAGDGVVAGAAVAGQPHHIGPPPAPAHRSLPVPA